MVTETVWSAAGRHNIDGYNNDSMYSCIHSLLQNGFFYIYIYGISLKPLSKTYNHHTHIHTHTLEPTMQGDSSGADRERRLAQRHNDTLARRSRGIALATFRIPVNPLYLLLPPTPPQHETMSSCFLMTWSHVTL